MNIKNYKFRTVVKLSDVADVDAIVRSTGFFREDEILVAVELVQERLDKGIESGYEFVFFDVDDKPVAYTCYGLIPCSLISYDLYWIVTHQEYRGQGIGKMLMAETETRIADAGGKTVYVETSSKEMYKPTCAFYLSNKYILKAQFEDFYDAGDDKLVFIKKV
jgi:GNAT superfamily N-acetyltransferase